MKTTTDIQVDQQYQVIDLTAIVPSKTNPRQHFEADSLNELAASIKLKGVLQPIVVRMNGKPGTFELVVGERRWRASKIAGVVSIPAVIRDLSDDEVLDLQIIENLQRKDVHPMEEAGGFKHLQTVKQFDVQEIARRVGKSPHYVAQRLKLNELIAEWQKLFYDDLISLKDSMRISKMSKPDQKELWDDEGERATQLIKLNDWDFRKFTNKLKDAPFDIKDSTLKKDMGACTTCTFNSAVNTLLFPDQAANPICLNSQCFKQKCNISFDNELKVAIEDPTIMLIHDDYNQADKAAQAIIKTGVQVLSRHEYSTIDIPEFDEADFDRDDYDSDKEYQESIQKARKEHQSDLDAYDKKIASGKFIKAYMVNGNDKGKYRFIELRKKSGSSSSSQAAKAKIETGQAAPEDYKLEIERIQTREKRSKEIDEQRIWEQLKSELSPKGKIPILTGKLIPVEREAIAMAISNKIDYTHRNAFSKLFPGKDFSKITDDILFKMLRFFFLSVLPPGMLYSGFTPDAKVCIKVAEAYLPATLHKIQDEQAQVATKRQKRVEQRIAQLRALMKEKPAEKKNTAAPKKKMKK